ncbi:uncharacterized protein VTP21DRAFT_1397 [Calcarisporiella thermophila]|uniref:uncharacterized protein n=1 Tax=Calcarisporiella thermophila TaxID=911321 RepID=UPI003743ECF3
MPGELMDLDADCVYMISEQDIPYEEEILRNPYVLRTWMRYIEYKADAPQKNQIFVYERALRELPGSYKLWKRYLDLRRAHVKSLNPASHEVEYRRVNNCFERALVLLHKMPRIWLDYCSFLMTQCCVTRTRRTFDRALRALPITQHPRIWDVYLQFANKIGGETAIRIYRRYLKLEPNHVEDYIELLISLKRYDEAASRLAQVVSDERFKSRKGKSHYQLWMELCDLACKHPKEIKNLNVEPIIRSGIKRFTDQVGKLWNSLARYWILMGYFEKARDTFEEAIASVMTVRDFTQVFDAYAEFEESVITTKMELAAERAEPDPEEDLDLDLRLARFEQLMERRPFLVNDVLLRQNPNNVHEWMKRVALCGDDLARVVETYTQAIDTIKPRDAVGKLPELWTSFAKLYEEDGDLDAARTIFEKAVKSDYKQVNDLAEMWCQYAEMELRHDEYDRALEVLGRATAPPSGTRYNKVDFHDESISVQQRVHKSLKLWSFYVDLEESIGTVESAKAVYDRILELRIATPQIIVNYATFLEEHKYFEESFKVYERGVEAFGYPIAFELWNIYLSKFIKRYGGTKLERTRDLFEQALEKCPPKYAKPLYLMYGKLEEEHGLARHAMRIYDRATSAVSDEDRFEMFIFYIAKVSEFFGVTATREIYERAIEALPDKDAREICLRYAQMERKLGEIDRARAIYGYASQFCDPRTVPSFWQTWHEFEVKHGNEDTFKEMLRIKRSVQAQYNTEVNFISAQMLAGRQQQKQQQENANQDGEMVIEDA